MLVNFQYSHPSWDTKHRCTRTRSWPD